MGYKNGAKSLRWRCQMRDRLGGICLCGGAEAGAGVGAVGRERVLSVRTLAAFGDCPAGGLTSCSYRRFTIRANFGHGFIGEGLSFFG